MKLEVRGWTKGFTLFVFYFDCHCLVDVGEVDFNEEEIDEMWKDDADDRVEDDGTERVTSIENLICCDNPVVTAERFCAVREDEDTDKDNCDSLTTPDDERVCYENHTEVENKDNTVHCDKWYHAEIGNLTFTTNRSRHNVNAHVVD